MDRLACLVPLKRSHRVVPVLESLRESTPEPYSVYFICAQSEPAQQLAVRQAGLEPLIVTDERYAPKVNHGVQVTSEPLLFLGADDLRFHPGWLEEAEAKLSEDVGVVGTNDLCNPRVVRGEHSTHSLVARWYAERGSIDEADKLLHEGYLHEYVDDEFVATAKKRQAFAFAEESIVEHLHPSAGKAPMDKLYSEQRQRMRAGRRVFYQRKRLWR